MLRHLSPTCRTLVHCRLPDIWFDLVELRLASISSMSDPGIFSSLRHLARFNLNYLLRCWILVRWALPVFSVCTGHLRPHRASHNLLHRLWMRQRLSQARRLSVILVTLIFSSPLVDSSLTLLDADSLGLALSFRPAAYTFSRIARTLAASFVEASAPSQTCRIFVYFDYQAIGSFSMNYISRVGLCSSVSAASYLAQLAASFDASASIANMSDFCISLPLRHL